MNEHTNSSGYLENEIAELSRQIEIKRRQLETEHGIVSDRELLTGVIVEQFNNTQVDEPEDVLNDIGQLNVPASLPVNQTISDDSYLQTLDDQSVASVNALIALVPERGIVYAIKEAKKQSPFILDAFHDVLIDRLYDELKTRGIVV